MIEKMREAKQLARAFRDDCMHRLMGVKEAGPGHLGSLRRQRGFTDPTVERVIAVPERLPREEVLLHYGANLDFVQRSMAWRYARTPRR